MTAGSKGPSLLQDTTFFDTIQSFNRERVPDRVVHGKGAGKNNTVVTFIIKNVYGNACKISSKAFVI